MKNVKLLLYVCVLLLGGGFSMRAQEVKRILLPEDASQVLDFSAKEVQKYIYLRTKAYLPIGSDCPKIGMK